MIKMNTDIKYIIFAFIRGWCVRINPKNKEEEKYIHLENIGELNEKNKYLIDLHIQLYDNFSDKYSSIY
jgi:hypothetical protein